VINENFQKNIDGEIILKTNFYNIWFNVADSVEGLFFKKIRKFLTSDFVENQAQHAY
jgi:hypothetical protein